MSNKKKIVKDFDFDNVEFGKVVFHSLNSPLPSKPFELCVWMMVCDEEEFVEKSIRSAAAVADCFLIADTGSTDKTVEKTIDVCRAVQKPFYIVEIGDPKYPCSFPFFNFAAYRNRILRFASTLANWLLAIDASDEVRGGEFLRQSLPLIPEKYIAGVVQLQWNEWTHGFQRLLRSSGNARYKDARHNYFDLENDVQVDLRFTGFSLFQDRNSAKSSESKFKKDIAYFEWKLEHFPTDRRAMFYLAESYYNDNQLTKAYKQYEECSHCKDMWIDERYCSHLHCAEIAKKQSRGFRVVENHLLNAYNTLASPLAAIELFRLYRDDQRKEKEYFGPRLNQAYAFIMAACYCKDPQCRLHDKPRDIDETRWSLLASAAFEIGDAQIAVDGYIRAQRGRLLHVKDERQYYDSSFQLCWAKFGKRDAKLFENVPIEFLSDKLAKEVATALGKQI